MRQLDGCTRDEGMGAAHAVAACNSFGSSAALRSVFTCRFRIGSARGSGELDWVSHPSTFKSPPSHLATGRRGFRLGPRGSTAGASSPPTPSPPSLYVSSAAAGSAGARMLHDKEECAEEDGPMSAQIVVSPFPARRSRGMPPAPGGSRKKETREKSPSAKTLTAWYSFSPSAMTSLWSKEAKSAIR